MTALEGALAPHLPVLLVITPLFGAIFAAFLRHPAASWLLAAVVAWATAAFAIWAFVVALAADGPISYVMGPWAQPDGMFEIGIEYRLDALNGFVAALLASVGAVVIAYAKDSVPRDVRPEQIPWFYTMYLLCLAGLLGIAISGDAFNIFVFLEISSLSTYVLIALSQDRRALLAAYQYLIVGTIGATLYVIGVGLLYVVTGTLNLADLASQLAEAEALYSAPVIAALAFITVGVGLKLALFPMHAWLPNAYAYAPSAATAFLAGTATKVAVYVLIRMYFSIYGPALGLESGPVLEIMLALSVAAMFLASLSAAFEGDVKRMLAYSSVAQIGYIMFGVSLANETGLTGGMTHLFNHAVIKAALFLTVGAVAFHVGGCKLDDMAGLGRRMPLTMGAFVIAGLGLIGVPGTAGFISKWYLALGALEAGLWPLLFVLLLSSVIAVVYIGKVVEVAYFREAPESAMATASDPPLSMLIPILFLAGATLYFGVETSASADVAAVIAETLFADLRVVDAEAGLGEGASP